MSKHKKHKSTHAEQHDDTAPAGVVDAEASAAPLVDDAANAAEDPVAKLQREVVEWKDKYLRAKAEQANALRRADNERNEAIRYANVHLLRDLVEVADDFERVLEASKKDDSIEGVIGGVSLVQEKLAKFLRDHHVEVIEAENVAFDPAHHEALLQQPSADHEPGTVIQQVQRGYRLRDRVLRPAKVIVASAPVEEGSPAENGDSAEVSGD